MSSIQKNSIFIATSLDGCIADRDGKIDWLHEIPNPDNDDMGYSKFISGIDALIMGRTTFETVCGFDIDWPYDKPVFVLSRTMSEIPQKYKDNVQLVKGSLTQVLAEIHRQGYHHVYVDGGETIQSFLNEDLIDDMIITIIPKLLGGGKLLFSNLNATLDFECISTQIFLGKVVQNHFRRLTT